MTRNFKALFLAVVGVLAMSAMAASAAQANEPAQFHATSPTDNVIVHVTEHQTEGLQEFETDVGNVECNLLTATGTEPKTSTTVTLDDVTYKSNFIPGSENCEAFGLEAEINFNGCHYLFEAGTWNGTDATGFANLTCEAGKEVEIITEFCTVSVPPQGPLGGITYTNAGGGANPMDVTVDANSTEIAYSSEGLLCETLERENGVYRGKATVRAYQDVGGQQGAPVDVTVGPHS